MSPYNPDLSEAQMITFYKRRVTRKKGGKSEAWYLKEIYGREPAMKIAKLQDAYRRL